MEQVKRINTAQDAQKQEALLSLLSLTLIVLNTAIFACCWFAYYEKRLYLRFEGVGDYMLLALFFGLDAGFERLYGGFDLMTSRVTELVYSHVIAQCVSHTLIYFAIWMLVRLHMPTAVPLLLCLVCCCAADALWSCAASRLAGKICPPKRTLLLYDNPEAHKSGARIAQKYRNRFILIGEVSAQGPEQALYAQIEEQKAEAVLLCGIASSRRNDILKYCVEHEIAAYVRPNIGDFLISNAQTFRMDNLPIMLCRQACPSFYYLFAKRAGDIVLSGLALIVTSPLMLGTALAIKLYDGGPVLFTQKRMTQGREEFVIHKFRSMCVDADKGGKGIVTLQNDARITPVGRVIRACRLDELPQLFDVFIGKMTIVGPRPERLETIELYEREMPEFAMRLQVKAGLTGYAQVYGKANTDPYDKLQMDLMYIGEQSIVTDLKIMFATIKVLFMPESTEGFAEEKDAPETTRDT